MNVTVTFRNCVLRTRITVKIGNEPGELKSQPKFLTCSQTKTATCLLKNVRVDIES